MKYTFTFKEINTQKNLRLFADSSCTISDFVKNIKLLICNELVIYMGNYNIDIVEAGHYNNSNGYAPELADKVELMYNENDTLEKIYRNTWKSTSFYIRITNAN